MLDVKSFSKNCIDLHPTFFEQKYLLGFSGGLDSAVLFDLLLKSNARFSVAHLNYNLRGNDSLEDEIFVKNLCQENQIPFYSKSINTLSLKKNRTSLQMLCRDLRYTFFEEIMQKEQLDFLLTAHHSKDNIESFFLNMFRGSGLKGLSAIPEKTDKILRPLLTFSRNEIEQYATTNKLKFREDKSNKKSIYKRNFLRLNVFPLLDEQFPKWEKKTSESIQYLKEINSYLEKQLNKDFQKLFIEEDKSWKVKKADLVNLENFQLHYHFKQFGFHSLKEIRKILEAQTSQFFQNSDYKIHVDRNFLYIVPLEKELEIEQEYTINTLNTTITEPLQLKIEPSNYKDHQANFSLDADLISFPLTLRKRKVGDRFQPQGLQGSKKLGKFLKDEKIPLHEKDRVWLLLDNKNNILSVLNIRQDQRFLAHEQTHNYLNFYL